MARKTKEPDAKRVKVSDKGLIKRLKREAPDAPTAAMPKAMFDSVMDNLLKASPSEDRPRFYCRPCGQYHEKTHPHHAAMMKRKRKNAR